MEKWIKQENLRSFAYINENVCQKPIKGIVLSFMGLGGMELHFDETNEGRWFGERGYLYVLPYNNPWAWMNQQSVDYTDEILDLLFEKYNLPKDFPVISTGGSMGGLAALTYCVYAKRTPKGCVAVCPVCDLVYHSTERPDLPRTIYSALWHDEGTMEEAMKTRSPFHLAEKMPKINYLVFHTGADTAVNVHQHTERFLEAMKQVGKDVNYRFIPDRGHCDLPADEWDFFRKTVIEFAEK